MLLQKLKSILFLGILLCLFPFSKINAQHLVLSDKAEISILTCDSGNELYSLFGHTALRIKDELNAVDAVYNYGYFDFRTPNFYLKFVKGDLQYFVAIDNFNDFLAEYVYEQRGVFEQKLNLTTLQKQKIFDDLNAVLASDNRFYTYKFIDRNCTSMVVDVINKNINAPISNKVKDSGKTNRTILYGYLSSHFYENLGINIMFGAKTDRQFDKIYLPLQLMESLKISKNDKLPISSDTKILNINSATELPFSLWNNCYSYLLFFILIALWNKKAVYISYFVVNGLLGIFLFWAGFYSLHEELSLNYNILLFNPLLLLLAFFIVKKKFRLALKTAYLYSFFILIYFGLMLNKPHFLMFSPMIATNLILLTRIILANRKKLAN
jgi:hypothetical protein